MYTTTTCRVASILLLILSLSLSVRIVHLRKKRSIIPSRPVRFFLRNKYACSHSNNNCCFAYTIGGYGTAANDYLAPNMHFAPFAKVQNWLVKKLITIKFSFLLRYTDGFPPPPLFLSLSLAMHGEVHVVPLAQKWHRRRRAGDRIAHIGRSDPHVGGRGE